MGRGGGRNSNSNKAWGSLLQRKGHMVEDIQSQVAAALQAEFLSVVLLSKLEEKPSFVLLCTGEVS